MNKEKEINKGRIIKYLEIKLRNTNFTPEKQRYLLLAADIIINLVTVIFLVAVMRTFILSPFQVYGISMCNTFNYFDNKCQDTYGDYLIINKSSYLHFGNFKIGTPQRGDVIVFHPPQDHQQFYIKRVIGLPGETVKLIDGYVYIINKEHPEGIKLDEPYLNSDNLGNTFATGGIDQFQVPENQYFALGDNRKHSSDSRICFKESPGGPGCGDPGASSYLTIDLIEGKAALALWPQPRIIYTHQYSAFTKQSS